MKDEIYDHASLGGKIMEHTNFDELLQFVEQARNAVIEAQMNFNSEEYQRALRALKLAKDQLSIVMHQDLQNEEQATMVHHAKEHLMHLNETLVALQSIQ
jgi:nitrogenase subunit NifH